MRADCLARSFLVFSAPSSDLIKYVVICRGIKYLCAPAINDGLLHYHPLREITPCFKNSAILRFHEIIVIDNNSSDSRYHYDCQRISGSM